MKYSSIVFLRMWLVGITMIYWIENSILLTQILWLIKVSIQLDNKFVDQEEKYSTCLISKMLPQNKISCILSGAK